MKNYQIISDTGCDIAPELMKQWDVLCADMTFRFDGEDREYTEADMSNSAFYQKMRDGGVAKTAAVSMEKFRKTFVPVLQAGKDILYIARRHYVLTLCGLFSLFTLPFAPLGIDNAVTGVCFFSMFWLLFLCQHLAEKYMKRKI